MIRYKNNRPSAWLRRGLALMLALLMLCGISVSAADLEEVPYYSYCFWEGPSRFEAVPMRAMYEPEMQISGASLGTTELANADYITLSKDYKTLYIMDSGNGRILAVDAATKTLIKEIGEIQSPEGALNYTGSTGLYVSEEGEYYIADTKNNRVIIADDNGQCLRVLTRPEDDMSVPEDLTYSPIRVLKDDKDYLYVAVVGGYYGMMVYDTEYNFLGFHGSFKVEQSVLTTIKGWITSLFMTNEKAEQSAKKNPADILDISIDQKGMLYTLSSGNYGQIKRLGLNGNQTLNHKFGFTTQSGDLISFKENPPLTTT